MQLIGMLDSPYVRRVAISLQLLGLRFEHRPLSVFRTFDEFARINPVVKAPTLVCDDGAVLMDSSLILQYAEALAGRSLWPGDATAFRDDLRIAGLALAACEKSVQIVYERMRPPEKVHDAWIARVRGQLRAAFGELERELARNPPMLTSANITQGGLSAAVAWHFARQTLADAMPPTDFPSLAACSARAEGLPEFMAAPHGEGAYPQGSLG